MKTFIHKTIVALMVVLLVMATGGFSIYHHFCHCLGESKASIFMEASCEHDRDHSAASCCHHPSPASCCPVSPSGPEDQQCPHDNCCKDAETFLKISDTFTVSTEKVILKLLSGSVVLLSWTSMPELHAPVQYFSSGFNDTSPPLYGRKLVTRLHQLKIGSFLA